MLRKKFKVWLRFDTLEWIAQSKIFRFHQDACFEARALCLENKATDWCVRTSDQDPNDEDIMSHAEVTRLTSESGSASLQILSLFAAVALSAFLWVCIIGVVQSLAEVVERLVH